MRLAGPLIIFLALYTVFSSPIHAQYHRSIVWIKVHDPTHGTDSLVFGNVDSATYDVDPALGENPSPPFLPGFVAVWMSIPGRVNTWGYNGLLVRDYRAYPVLDLGQSHQIDTFRLFFRNDGTDSATANADVTIYWPCAEYLRSICDSILIVDARRIFLSVPLNILAADSLVIHKPYASDPAQVNLMIYKFGIREPVDCLLGPESGTGAASGRTTHSATVHGSAIENCGKLDHATFQFDTSTAYRFEVPAVPEGGYQYSATLDSLRPNTVYHYRIYPYFSNGPAFASLCQGLFAVPGSDSTFLTSPSGSVAPEKAKRIPSSFSLAQNYPNPFNPSTSIHFSIATTTHVVLSVYSVLGERVRTLVDDEHRAGEYAVVFDGADLSSGVYFYQLSAGSFLQTRKMLLIR